MDTGRGAELPASRAAAAWPALAPAWLLALLIFSSIAGLLAGDWIAAAALWVLWVGCRYLRADSGPPVLAVAFAFQWVQVTAAIYYQVFTGRRLAAMELSDYRPMVLIGLGCLLALLLGLKGGTMLVQRHRTGQEQTAPALTARTLIVLYAVAVALTGTFQELAWEFPALTQGILALTYARFALLFMIFRRLSEPRVRLGLIAVVLAFEVALGFTGYFAGFREPMMMAAVALMGVFDRRKVKHWIVLGGLAVLMLFTGVMWMGVRREYRQDFESQVFAESREARLERIAALSSKWVERRPDEMVSDVELFVDRLWAVYYPALAVSRVPAIVPHENGTLLWNAVWHLLTPRLLFPDKPGLESDSEMVRKYSGVFVAGPEENTSIAFGYAAESYVDFGVPGMFLPVFLYALLMGMAYAWMLRLIRHQELAIAAATVIFWLSLYLFERSWAKTLGDSVTLLAYLGGATFVLDRLLLWQRRRHAGRPGARPLPRDLGRSHQRK